MIRGHVRYDAGLVEAAVLAASEGIDPGERGQFRARRDALYALRDPDEREAAFEALHGEWFVRLGLDRPLHSALAEQPAVVGLGECRVVPARARREEMADLVGAASGPLLVVRLRPESFLRGGALLELMRRELLHVADMLDPDFGYERDLPPSDEGPSWDNVIRDRYRAAWAASVAGRLARGPGVGGRTLSDTRRDFARAFAVLGCDADAAFERWAGARRPTHRALLAFARDPDGRGHGAGRCAACRLPSAALIAGGDLGAALRVAAAEYQPASSAGSGLCPQCRDLLAARVHRGSVPSPQGPSTRSRAPLR